MGQNAAVFDPRYNNLMISVNYRRAGSGLPGSRDLTLKVTEGEGECWLDAPAMPVLGPVTEGRLVMASESFPRYAPLTLSLTGADLVFLVRDRQVLNLALTDGREMIAQFFCNGLWTAPYRYQLRWLASAKRVVLSRLNWAELNGVTHQPRETRLEINVVDGKGEIVGALGDFGIEPQTGLVIDNQIVVRRAADGELKLQLHGARMEWDFRNGVVVGLRVFESQGAIANLRLLDRSAARIGMSVAFMDTLP
jgi:hypothetical protein